MATFFGMPGNGDLAEELAVLAGSEVGGIETRRFPDGETYVRIHDAPTEEAVLVCTLARPDEQFLPLVFAARAIRASGAKKVTLVAPYLAYLRQDRQFQSGEAISSRIFADLINREFDALVTVDPHLHRYASLAEIYNIPTILVHAAGVIGAWIRDNVKSPAVIGPDDESAQWVEEVAHYAGCPWAVFGKERHGDRDVTLAPPNFEPFLGSTPVIVDDIVSSGTTMIGAAKVLLAAGLRPGFCVAVHALFDDAVSIELASRFQRVLTSDSIPNRFSQFEVAPLIAKQLV